MFLFKNTYEKIRILIKSLLLLFVCVALNGCFHYYYKVQRESPVLPEQIDELKNNNKYFVLHTGTQVYEFNNLSVDSISLSGTPEILPENHYFYLKTKAKGSTRYKKRKSNDQSYVLDEVHIYADVPVLRRKPVRIPLEKVYNVEIYQPAKGATAASMIGGTVCVAATAVLTGAIIAGVTQKPKPAPTTSGSSCPYIYAFNGEKKELVGEIYSGAIYSTLERNDYLPLPNYEEGKSLYSICMTNELEEIQHTNLIELIAIDHSLNETVLIDKNGNPHTISDLRKPSDAVNIRGENILDKVTEADSLKYGENEIFEEQTNDGIILTFKRPENVTNAKLVIKAKNTMWLDYVVLRFHELFGEKYECWIENQDKIPDKRMKDWVLKQNIPLSVYIEKNGKWKFLDYYNIAGPVALKEDVLSFRLPKSNSDYVKIKLESGYMFWEIDYVGIDFSEDKTVTTRLAKFDKAIDNNGKDVKSLLESSDDKYYVQPEIGDEVTMNFILPDMMTEKQSLYLHSQGYYIRKMDSKGEYYRKYLLAFRKKGKMVEFSNQLMQNQYKASAN